MNKLLNKKYSKGLSLIEVMVSLLVGIILIGGIASVYLASKRSYIEVERMSRMTQNSRFAIQMVSEAIQHAGFVGEVPIENIVRDASLDDPVNDCEGTASVYNIEHYLRAAIADASGAGFGCIADAVPGTSMILVKNVRPMRMVDGDEDGTIDTPEALNGTTSYIISNNTQGIIFDGADTAPSIEEGGDVPNGNAWEYQVQIYYIRDAGEPTLARRIMNWNAGAMGFTTEDLIAGVENMTFLFGMDSTADGEIDTFRTIANITANNLDTLWSQVAAVEVDVLVRSETEDPAYTDTKVYNFGDQTTVGPLNDNFYRMVMQNTVLLRNPKFVIRGNL